MLSEGFKIDLLRRDREALKAERRAKDISTGSSVGKYVGGVYISRHVDRINDALIAHDMRKREKKYAKLRKKNAMRQRHESLDEGKIADALAAANKVRIAVRRNKILKVPRVHGKLAYKKYLKPGVKAVTGWVAKNPIKAAIGTTALSVVGSAVSNVATNYMAHKGKMKTDPNYAEMSHYNQRMQDMRKGKALPESSNPSNPGEAGAYRSPQGSDSHSSPLTRQIISKGAQGSHQQHHGHVAVMRGMAQNKVNTAGLAGKKFQRQDVKQKTNTRASQTADVHMLDNIIEDAANNIYLMEGWGSVAAAAVKKVGSAAAKVAGSRAYRTARVIAKRKVLPTIKRGYKALKNSGAAKKAGDFVKNKALPFAKAAKNKVAGHVQKNVSDYKKSVSEQLAERTEDFYIQEVAPAVAAAGVWALKKAGTAAAAWAGKKILKKAFTPRQQTADVEGDYYPLGEGVAPGAASPYSLNRNKDPRAFYHAGRDEFLNSAPEKINMVRQRINRRSKNSGPMENLEEGKYKKEWRAAGANVKIRKLSPAVKKLTQKVYAKSLRKEESVEGDIWRGVKTGVKGVHKWANTGDRTQRTRRKAGILIGALGARKLWKMRASNEPYQLRMAEYHARKAEQHQANVDYSRDKRDAKERWRQVHEETEQEKEKRRKRAAAYLRDRQNKKKDKDDDKED